MTPLGIQKIYFLKIGLFYNLQKMEPKITVVMPVYNGEKYIREAIDSILNQTFSNFELLIIDDGSTDNSVKIIKTYKDKRINLIHNFKNMGLVFTRNRGLLESKTEYIALLDCDDIAHHARLEKQHSWLEKNTDFGLIGSWVELIDLNGKSTKITWKEALKPEEIPCFLLFKNCFTQSAIMIRKSALPKEYYRNFAPAEDFDLWVRIAQKWKTWNLPEILTKYRKHQDGISARQKEIQNQSISKIISWQLFNLEIIPTPEDLEIHQTNYFYSGKNVTDFINKREKWLEKIKKANEKINFYPEPFFSRTISKLWLKSCSSNTNLGLWIFKRFWQSPLKKISRDDLKPITKLFIKCLFKKTNIN